MGQTLRDWYRYLERQMHVTLPTEIGGAPAGEDSRPPERVRSERARAASPDGNARPVPVERMRNGSGPASGPVPGTETSDGTPAVLAPPPPGAAEPVAPAETLRRRVLPGVQDNALPMDLGPRGRPLPRAGRRGGRRPITETREEIIRRLLDPELTLHEAAAVLNLSKATVRRYTDHGRLACLRTEGGQRRFRLSVLLSFLDAQTQARDGA